MPHLDHPRDRHYPEDREREREREESLARWQGRELARRRDNDSPTDGRCALVTEKQRRLGY